MKVSLITVTLNCDLTIDTCLQSVDKQSYPNIEHLIIDGVSTDNTIRILEVYKGRIALLLSEPDLGIYDALNKGIMMSTGDVIGVLHSDDFFMHNNVISDVMDIFHKNPEIPIIFGNVEYVSRNQINKVVRLYSSSRFKVWMLRFGFMPAHTSTFIRTEVFEKVGGYNLRFISAGDFDFFLRALWVHKLSYLSLNQTLVRMRMGGISSSGLISYWRSSREILSALRMNGVYSNLLFV